MNTRKISMAIRANSDTNSFEGRACQFNVIDSYGTTFTPGCFTKGGLENTTYALLWMHNPNKPIGTFNAEERMDGLYIVGKWDESTEGQNARASAISGSAGELSVGFEWVDYESDTTSTEIKEARLVEVSQVTTRFAAVPGSKFVSARAGRILSAANEQALRDAAELIESVLDQVDGTPASQSDETETDENRAKAEAIEVTKRSQEALSLIVRLALAE